VVQRSVIAFARSARIGVWITHVRAFGRPVERRTELRVAIMDEEAESKLWACAIG
jgi:hypothetical protein